MRTNQLSLRFVDIRVVACCVSSSEFSPGGSNDCARDIRIIGAPSHKSSCAVGGSTLTCTLVYDCVYTTKHRAELMLTLLIFPL